jgi:hypothetical protein
MFDLSDSQLLAAYSTGARTNHVEAVRAVARLTSAAAIRKLAAPRQRATKPRPTRRPPAPSTIEGRVYLALSRLQCVAGSLRNETGLSLAQVRGALRRLEAKAFAKRTADGAWVRA